MKKQYTQPEITELGSVETLTQAFGNATDNDTFTYNSEHFPGKGSKDGTVTPNS